MNEQLKAQLLRMAEEDRRVRAQLAETGDLYKGYAPQMAAVHLQNAQQLEGFIRSWGWPGKSLVGEEGAAAAWLIVQHAIGTPNFQRMCLPLLKEAVARKEAEAAQVAYLEDRIAFYERRPQRYGTQFDWDEDGQMSPWTLEDAQRVDEYRRSVGLGPLAEKMSEVHEGTKHETPPDFQKRQQELMDWARSVGWL